VPFPDALSTSALRAPRPLLPAFGGPGGCGATVWRRRLSRSGRFLIREGRDPRRPAAAGWGEPVGRSVIAARRRGRCGNPQVGARAPPPREPWLDQACRSHWIDALERAPIVWIRRQLGLTDEADRPSRTALVRLAGPHPSSRARPSTSSIDGVDPRQGSVSVWAVSPGAGLPRTAGCGWARRSLGTVDALPVTPLIAARCRPGRVAPAIGMSSAVVATRRWAEDPGRDRSVPAGLGSGRRRASAGPLDRADGARARAHRV
jgi:hypothetical protein